MTEQTDKALLRSLILPQNSFFGWGALQPLEKPYPEIIDQPAGTYALSWAYEVRGKNARIHFKLMNDKGEEVETKTIENAERSFGANYYDAQDIRRQMQAGAKDLSSSFQKPVSQKREENITPDAEGAADFLCQQLAAWLDTTQHAGLVKQISVMICADLPRLLLPDKGPNLKE